MADKAAPTLMNLPLEVRHAIFDYATAREVKPKKLLRYWFEKKDIKRTVADLAVADPDGPAPRIVYGEDCDDFSEATDVSDEDDVEQEHDSEDDEDQEAQEQEDQEDDGEDDEDGDDMDDEHDVDQNAEEQGEEANYGENGDAMNEVDTSQAINAPSALVLTATQAAAPVQAPHATQAAVTTSSAIQTETNADDLDDNDEQVQGATTIMQDVQGANDADGDENMAVANENGDVTGSATAAVTPPPPPPPLGPVVSAHRKWRHIPNFMRITHCPPPLELLLSSKQLNNEAKSWFYDVAMLRIEATGSFAHTSFFEEAFSQITEAAFSPMENIRKVEVTFVWDSTWIRADTSGAVDAIFPALLRERSDFVFKILKQAPNLREVTIHWHDSAQDDESANLRLDILDRFYGLLTEIMVEEHYIAADARPLKRSTAGKRRAEFQNIVNMGLDRLF